MDYESDVEDERSEFNTSEIDWGEEQDLSGSEEEEKDYNSWKGDADSEFSTGEAYERNEEHWDDETESESVFYEEEEPDKFVESYHEDKPWCEETESQISLVETDPNDEEDFGETNSQISLRYTNQSDEANSEVNFGEEPEYAEEYEYESDEDEEEVSEAGRDDHWEDLSREDEVVSTTGN